MSNKIISSGTIHRLPLDLRKVLESFPKAEKKWEEITPLARNEWICWVENAKKKKLEIEELRE